MNKISFLIKNLLIISILFINCLIIYLDRYFGEVSLEQLIFHLNFANNLLVDTDDYIIEKFFQICIFVPLIIILMINIFYFTSFNFKKIYNNSLFFISLIILICLSLFKSSESIKFGNIYKETQIDVIEKNYINPNKIDFNFYKSQNLILVYMESFENIFKNKEIFGENLIEEISDYKKDDLSFENFIQTPLTNWTIASIVASQCGLPLKNYGLFTFGKQTGKHLRTVFGFDKFLPNAICLGDILKKNKYKNIFVGSHNTSFTGTGNFFKTHGYDEIYGKEIYEKLGLDFHPGSWSEGPHDSFLFDFSINKIESLIKENKKFNLTILSTDTHEPFGFHDPVCNYEKKIINSALKCSSKNLLKFVNFVENNYSDKIRIVILGDHLYRFGNNYSFEMPEKRTIFNKFILNNNKKIMRDTINHYDFYPTILDFIDVTFDRNKVGLGYSGFKEVKEEKYLNEINELEQNIYNKSLFYENFWK